jgi:hypothetical protein
MMHTRLTSQAANEGQLRKRSQEQPTYESETELLGRHIRSVQLRLCLHRRGRTSANGATTLHYVDFHTILALPEATGRELTPENFHPWSPLNGITVLGTGDFTPPA